VETSDSLKKRILFVDDQPLITMGLQRMLRPMREEWDMAFVGSGAEALALMAEAPFDVVVTDARMPGMTGPQLLEEVMRLYPATVRLVLSGYADRDILAQCVGVAHQYITKPCDSQQLRSLIQNASQLSGQNLSEGVKRIIGSIEHLPSVPEVFLELTEALNQEDPNPQRLGDIMGKDMAMTAEILKIVNSAFFGLRRTISTPQEAIAYLGIETIKNLVLVNHLFEKSIPFATRLLTIEDLWRHSMAVASGARAIAMLETQEPKVHEEAFVGGILHDVGILILAGHCPEAYDRVLALVARERMPLLEAERGEFGVTHAEVGAHLLGLWGLPASLLEMVSLHHHPAFLDRPCFSPLLAVHAADVFIGGSDPIQAFTCHLLDEQALSRVGLAHRVKPWKAAALAAISKP